jgi:hypothetical protein
MRLRNNLGKKSCDNISLRSEYIEKAVLTSLGEKIFTKDNLIKIATELNKNRSNVLNEINREKKSLKFSIKESEKRISNLLKSLEKGIDEDTVIPRINELKEKKEALISRLIQIEDSIPCEFSEKDIEEVVKIIQDGLNNSEPERLNSFLKIFIDKIVIFKDKVEIYYTFPQVNDSKVAFWMVPRDGIEPPTRGFSVRCSTY